MKRIVAFHGGLGNQMFEYALFFALSERYSDVVANFYFINRNKEHNGLEIERLFKIHLPEVWYGDLIIRLIRKFNYLSVKSSFLKRLNNFLMKMFSSIGSKICLDDSHGVYKASFLNEKNKIFWGTWHSEKYFQPYDKQIRQIFSFDTLKLNPKSENLTKELQNCESVSIHVRRGDFLLNPAFGEICTAFYYTEAIKTIQNLINKPFFFVFSDDVKWAKENLPLQNAIFIDWNKGSNSWQDMYLMSKCKHNIIANSTFSWWGAWLNNNPTKVVICPDRILNNSDPVDLFPDHWIKIKSNIIL